MTPLARAFLFSAITISVPAGAQAPANLPVVTITLVSHQFTPSPILLKAGQPVRLVFENKAGKGHDFTARQFFAASRILAGTAPRGEIDLEAGESATIDLVPARGNYEAHCGKFMHAPMGMKTRVVVE